MPTLQTPEKATSPAEKLRELRYNAGLSPEQLGQQIGVSGDTIRRIEAGVGGRCPHPRTMFLLAQAFDLDVVAIWPPEAS